MTTIASILSKTAMVSGEIVEFGIRGRRNDNGLWALGLAEKGEPCFDEQMESAAEERLLGILKEQAQGAPDG